MEVQTVYFEKPGRQNTAEALRIARRRAEELGIRQVVLASSHGSTALAAAEAFRGANIELIAVSISAALISNLFPMRSPIDIMRRAVYASMIFTSGMVSALTCSIGASNDMS